MESGALVATGKPYEGWSQQRPQETNMLCDLQSKHTPSKDLEDNCVVVFSFVNLNIYQEIIEILKTKPAWQNSEHTFSMKYAINK